MSLIRGKHTVPELTMARLLRRAKIRFRRYSGLPGTPDFRICWPDRRLTKIVVFVDGEFWHGRDWERLRMKLEGKPYWLRKIARNMDRDRRVDGILRERGYLVLRFWDRDVTRKRTQPDVIRRVKETMKWLSSE
jgi:DNA mismatch endonuclease (patch repair protein)